MNRTSCTHIYVVGLLIALGCSACSTEESAKISDDVEIASSKSTKADRPSENDEYVSSVGKADSPYRIGYRIVGTPIVGSPIVVDLEVHSLLGPRPVNLDYRINDASSMMFSESQPASIQMKMAANESSVKQQITVIPQREGRFYLNVSASYETAGGTQSTVMAIPIQVGTGGRELQEHGTVELDENGEAVRVLSND
jgi:hypothetical protein